MKTKPEEMLEEIGDSFNNYLKKGMKLDSFSKKIDPDLNIENLDDLLKIHFILTESKDQEPGVIDFIEELPERLRRIKTTITNKKNTLEGEVKGKIDWQSTIKTRNSTGCSNNTLFVCNQTKKNYETKENLVLKELLSVIHEIVFDKLNELEFKGKEIGWLDEWSEDKSDLKGTVERVFHRNIYLKRIKHEEIQVTERMISDVKKSRNKLYREAATLLEKYRKLLDHDLDSGEAKRLLKNTFIKPEKTEVLFELYWIIKIIKGFEEKSDVNFKWIVKGENIIAEWEDQEHIYKIYHDSTGSLNFSINLEDIEEPEKDDYLNRQKEVIEKWKKMSKDVFKQEKSNGLWGGRPDIILERYNKQEELKEVFIGEVKYTENQQYALKGLKELLEYMALVKDKNSDFFENTEDILESKQVHGYLFTDKIELDHEQQENKIKIIPYGSEHSFTSDISGANSEIVYYD